MIKMSYVIFSYSGKFFLKHSGTYYISFGNIWNIISENYFPNIVFLSKTCFPQYTSWISERDVPEDFGKDNPEIFKKRIK